MKKIFFVLFIFCQSALNAQQVYNLTLEESIEIAKGGSYEIQRLLKDQVIAENELSAATARLRTNVSMNFTLPQYTKTVNEWQDSLGISYFSSNTLRGIGGLNIRQPLPTDGTVSIQTNLNSINDYTYDRRSTRFSTSIVLNQPLNSLWGYNSIRSDLKTARLNNERTNKALKRSELNLIYNVSNAFYGLLRLQKGLEIAQMNLERQIEASEISKNKYEAGLIREVENLQNEVDLVEMQNNYEEAKTSLEASTKLFIQLIGLELNANVTLKSEIDNYSIVTVDPNKAVEMALKNRLEIRENEIQIEMQKIQISRQRSDGLPQASLQASLDKIGISNMDISESFSNSISSSWGDLKDRPSNYNVGLTLSVPIIDWGRNRSLVRASKARLDQYLLDKENQERDIEVEVINLVADLQNTLSRLQSLEKSVSVAEKSYGITLQRYIDGDISSLELSMERDRLNRAQQMHLTAYINYQLSIADLMRKTFYDFENQRDIE